SWKWISLHVKNEADYETLLSPMLPQDSDLNVVKAHFLIDTLSQLIRQNQARQDDTFNRKLLQTTQWNLGKLVQINP
ncbi:hypothetical protein DF186_25675, partial [Enterococcus hirae]